MTDWSSTIGAINLVGKYVTAVPETEGRQTSTGLVDKVTIGRFGTMIQFRNGDGFTLESCHSITVRNVP